jgi:integrase
MGRPAEGWRVKWKRGWAYVHFTWEGYSYRIALRTRDRREAQEAAARAHAEVVSGRRRPIRHQPGRLLDLAELLDRWIAYKAPTIDKSFVPTLEIYARRWVDYFVSLDRITQASAGDLHHARLGEALRTTVLRERAYLVQFLEWCQTHGVIATTPSVPRLPPKARGTRTGTQRARSVHITRAEADKILALLPEQSKKIDGRKWPLRDRFAFAWESGLRPNTLARIRVPDTWRPGMKHLELSDMDDKARWGRPVDLTPAGVAILRRVAPDAGLVFGKHCFYKAIKKAAIEVLGEERGQRFAPYDFRHGRAKDWLDSGAKIRGVSYQLGHKRPSTTDKYLAPDRATGAEALRAGQKNSRTINAPGRKKR